MLIVQKYGGTSVGTLERIEAVANRVIQSAQQGNQLVVVVSAMSGVTNTLIEQAEYFSKTPNGKDMDMLLSSGERVTSALLSIALNEKGCPAISFSGRKAGIITDSVFTKARIHHIDTKAIKSELQNGKIVVIAGFQGVDEEGNVTTLGRGGSDLSAVAVAGALNADLCEFIPMLMGFIQQIQELNQRQRNWIKFLMKKCLNLQVWVQKFCKIAL